MFKHILIPTDGSELAQKAIQQGVLLAKEMGAKVTGFYAEEPQSMHLYSNGYAVERELIAQFNLRSREYADRAVGEIAAAAKAAGVAFEPLVVRSEVPYRAIVDAAKERKCDAIFMSSHGHKGIAGMLLGSVTQKVLSHTTVPVLVFR